MKTNLKRLHWLRVILATITAIALTFLYILDYTNGHATPFESLLQNVIPNIIAVLIGIPIIYLIFTQIGLSPEEEFKRGIVEDITKLNLHQSGFEKDSRTNRRFNFKEKLKRAKTIDIVALSALNIVSYYRLELAYAIKNNCKIRIVVIDPASEAANVVMENQRHKELIPDVNRLIERVKAVIEEAGVSKKNIEVEIRGINWVPSCSLVIYNREQLDCEIRVKVYPVMIDVVVNSILSNTIVYKRFEPEIANYLLSNYEELLKRSKVIL